MSDEYESHLLAVARRGLDAMSEFLALGDDVESGHYQRIHLKAKIGSKVVANHVRYMSAVNNRALLQAQLGGVVEQHKSIGPGDNE